MIGSRKRSLILSLAAILLCVVALPYLGFAQDSTPEAPEVASPVADDDFISVGEAIFLGLCVTCHQAGGAGFENIWPALAGNPLVTLEDPEYVTTTVLYGRGGMPRFNAIYNDFEIAAIVSYIRSELEGNKAAPISQEYVAGIREMVESAPATPDAVDSGQVDSPQTNGTPESD